MPNGTSGGITGNKENSKKNVPNDSVTTTAGNQSKMTLKAREFGREITNAATGQANSSSSNGSNTASGASKAQPSTENGQSSLTQGTG